MPLRHALPLATLLALGACGCCTCRRGIESGTGVDVYGTLELANEKKSGVELVVAAVDPLDRSHVYGTDHVERDEDAKVWLYGLLLPRCCEVELLAFADDGDGTLTNGELVGRATFRVEATGSGSKATGRGPTIRVDFESHGDAGLPKPIPLHHADLLYPGADAAFFAAAPNGWLVPSRLLAHNDNEFLFGIGSAAAPEVGPELRMDPDRKKRLRARLGDTVQAGKTQVVFVHGVFDTPAGMAKLSKALAPDLYQSWFFFYPTGLGLEAMGEELETVLRVMSEKAPTLLVAHSMGGLVSRQAIKLLAADPEGFPKNFKGYLSLATPYGGITPALFMPLLPKVPGLEVLTERKSFDDVNPMGAFMAHLYDEPYPADFPFFLFWGNGKCGGDGVVSKGSALNEDAVCRATRVCRFKLSHGGIKGEGDESAFVPMLDQFRAALDGMRDPKAARPVCPGEDLKGYQEGCAKRRKAGP